ncbi:MAG: ABC-F type ribosomal protection protein [Angelakisella sp.]
MSLINISNLTFAYDGSYDNIFENLSLQLDTDWKLGFTGRNGRGKTTFLSLLMGKHSYSGTISASVHFDYFPFPVPDKSRDTIEVVGEIVPEYVAWRLSREFSLLELSEELLYRPFDTLSNGEQTKVLLAALFLRDNNFLLIDEPTNHLDIEGRALVSRYLSSKSGFILVSHDRTFLDNCVDHILSINRAGIDLQKGNFSSWYYNKQLADSYELAENEKLKKSINHLTKAAKQTAAWSGEVEKTKYATRNSGLRPDRGYIGHKAAKMMKRAKTTELRREREVEKKATLLKNIEETENLKITPLHYHKERLVLLDDVSICYGDKVVCQGVSFQLRQGQKLALQGRNGCGKSSILKLIKGEDISFSGRLERGSNLIISYVPQDSSFLRGSLTDYAMQCDIDESLFKAILRKLDFSRIQFEKDMENYSGGQKKKVLIARSLCEHARLYIWDEPLNFIDVFSRMQIEELLKQFSPTMLFVEHDRAFCETICSEVVRL